MHRLFLSLLALALLLPGTVSALHPNVTELRGRPLSGPGPSNLGRSVAISDQFILAGDPSDYFFSGNSRGAAQVYDARTGRFLRRLECPDTSSPTPNFGISVAVEGHLGLVGAKGALENRGAAYLFDLRTGKLLQTLTAQDTMTAINLGVSVALHNGVAAVGSPLYGVAPAPISQGAVYLFDVLEGSQLVVYQPPVGQANMNFGSAVALQGRLMLVGAPGDNHAGSSSGSVFLFDWEGNQVISKLTESDATAGRRFGGRVALHGLRALICGDAGNSKASWFDLSQAGASMTETLRLPNLAGLFFNEPRDVALEGDLALVGYGSDNTVALFDTRNGRELGRFFAGSDAFGASVALSGGRAVAGMPSFSGPEGTTGAVFLFQPLALPLPAQRRAAKGDSARGLGAAFTRFTNATIGSNPSYGAFTALAGRAPGVWLLTDQDDRALPDPVAFKGAKVPGTGGENVFFGTVPRLIGLDEFRLVAEVTLTGPEVTGQSNRALVRGDDWFSGNAKIEFRTGQTIGDWDNAEVAGFQDVALSLDPVANGTSALAVHMRRGVAGVDKSNDSGVLEISLTNSSINDTAHREGDPSPDGNDYGQFLGRVARGANGVFTFPAYRLTDGGSQLSLWTSNNARVLREGDPEPGMSGDTTGLVLAETIGSVMSDPLFRYSLRGVPARNNEALYHEGVGLIARKGDSVGTDLIGGEGEIQRILGFWPVHEEAAVFWVKMKGRGFRATNDLALVLRQEDGSFLPLVQEGQVLPGAGGARVGVIQRVDVDPLNGHYAVQVSLTGDKARNQALLTGHARAGNTGQREALRSPDIALRKGTLYQSRPASAVTRLRSLNLYQKTDKGGAGAKGSGQSINDSGRYIIEVVFDNRARELLVSGE